MIDIFSNVYNLPTDTFVGGETRTFQFNMYDLSDSPVDMTYYESSFSIINYSNKIGVPIITTPCTVFLGDEGVMNVLRARIEAQDTALLYGKYIYQISVKGFGRVEIPGQGLLHITKNINHGFSL